MLCKLFAKRRVSWGSIRDLEQHYWCAFNCLILLTSHTLMHMHMHIVRYCLIAVPYYRVLDPV